MEIKSNKNKILLKFRINFVFILISSIIILAIGNNLQAAFSQGYIPPPPSFSSPSQNNLQSQSTQQCPQVDIIGPTFLGSNGCVQPCPTTGQDNIPNGCPQPIQTQQQPTSTQNNLIGPLTNNNNNLGTNNGFSNSNTSTLLQKDKPIPNGLFLPSSPRSDLFIQICANDITGKWIGNDGGSYYIRQIGNDIWWFGSNVFAGSNQSYIFSNVFHGIKNGLDIRGNWQDVPLGQTKSSGDISLSIDPSGTKITKITATGGFGGSEWTKKCLD